MNVHGICHRKGTRYSSISERESQGIGPEVEGREGSLGSGGGDISIVVTLEGMNSYIRGS